MPKLNHIKQRLKEPTGRELQRNCGTAAIMTTSFVLHNNR